MSARAGAASESQFQEESFFEYHLYTLERPTTVQNNQTKQLSLLSAADIPITQTPLVLRGQPHYVRYRVRHAAASAKSERLSPKSKTLRKTASASPCPKGTIRVYKADAQGSLQFVGEDSIDHTPETKPSA